MDDHVKQLGLVAGAGAAIGVGVALGLGLRIVAIGALLGLGAGAVLGVAGVLKRRSEDTLTLPDESYAVLH